MRRHLAAFTDEDYKLLEALLRLIRSGERNRLDEKAAIILKLSPSTVRTRLSLMNTKYDDAKRFCKEFRSWQQRLYQKSGGKFHGLK